MYFPPALHNELVSRLLMAKLPNGLPRVSEYTEFLKITGREDNDDSFVAWSRAAATLMQPAAGRG